MTVADAYGYAESWLSGGAGYTFGWYGSDAVPPESKFVSNTSDPSVPVHESVGSTGGYPFYGETVIDTAAGTIKTKSFSNTAAMPMPIDALGKAAGVRISNYAQDSFTLLGPPPGTAVHLAAYLTIEGVLSNDGYFHGGWQSNLAHVWAGAKAGTLDGGIPMLFDYYQSGGAHSILYKIAVGLDVVAGTPFPYSFGMGTEIQGLDGHDVVADFSSTAQVSFDLPSGTWIESSTGFRQSSVPEPAAWLVLGLGVSLIGLAGFRRQSAV